MTTQDKNAEIARWMGLSYCEKYQYEGWYTNHEHNYRICDYDGLKYHSDWNWLMGVVERIETTQFDFTKEERYIRNIEKFKGRTKAPGSIFISYDDRKEYIGWYWLVSISDFPTIQIKESIKREKTKIEAVHEAVYQFVVWYQKQKQS